jgi:hypothetical protein
MCAPLLDAALPRKSTPVCNLSAPPATLTRRIGQVVVAEVINQTFEQMFREIMEKAFRPVRQIRIAMFNLERLDTQPTLWGTTAAERWGALDDAVQQLTEQPGKNVLMTGSQLALRKRDSAHITPKAKCPFTPQREMVLNLFGENLP